MIISFRAENGNSTENIMAIRKNHLNPKTNHCSSTGSCGNNQYYDNGICRNKVSSGGNCSSNIQCITGECIDNYMICSSNGCSTGLGAADAASDLIFDFTGYTPPAAGWNVSYDVDQPKCGSTSECSGQNASTYSNFSSEYSSFISNEGITFLGDYAQISSCSTV